MKKLLFSAIAGYTLISVALSIPVKAMQEQQQEHYYSESSILTSPAQRAEFYSDLMVTEMEAGNFENAQKIFAQWNTRAGFTIDYLIPQFSHNAILHCVVRLGNPALVKDVINAGAQVNRKNSNGSTPLHSAAKYSDNSEVITTLLNAGANSNALNKSGNIPLRNALKYLNIPAVKALLAHPNVNIKAEDRNGCAALQFFLNKHSDKPYKQEAINEIKKLLAPHLMTLQTIVIDHIFNNSDDFTNRFVQLPLDLQKTLFKELLRRVSKKT